MNHSPIAANKTLGLLNFLNILVNAATACNYRNLVPNVTSAAHFSTIFAGQEWFVFTSRKLTLFAFS